MTHTDPTQGSTGPAGMPIYCRDCLFYQERPHIACLHPHAAVTIQTWQGPHTERVAPEMRNEHNDCPDWERWHFTMWWLCRQPWFWCWLMAIGVAIWWGYFVFFVLK